jgi:hypothetical protein
MPRILDAISLGSIPLSADAISLDAGVSRSRIQIAKTGSWPASRKRPGGFSITPEMLRQMVKNHSHETPIDYNHLSVPPNGILPEQGIAAGWQETLELTDNDTKLYANSRWNPKAVEHIKNGEYRYISPTFLFSFPDPVTGEDQGAKLLCSALTNYPFLTGMQPVALSELHGLGIVNLVNADELTFNQRQMMVAGEVSKRFESSAQYTSFVDMDDTDVVVSRAGRLFKLSYKIEGGKVELGEELTEVVSTYVALTQTPPPPTGAKRTMAENQNEVSLTSLQADLQRMSGLVTTLQQTVTDQGTNMASLTAENKALKEQLAAQAAGSRVDQLIAEGKILPALKEKYTAIALNNSQLFEDLASAMTPVVKLNHEHGGNSNPGTTSAAAEFETTGDANLDQRIRTATGDAAISLMSELVAKKKKDENLSYSQAMNAVGNEFPGLFERYRAAYEVGGTPGRVQ